MEKHYFDWPVRVYYEDTDCARVVYYANYFRFMERARTGMAARIGLESGAAVLRARRRLCRRRSQSQVQETGPAG